jgi:hypothetical protein
MLFSPETYIGIDPTAGAKPIVYAAIDQELQMIALGGGDIDEILAFVGGQRQAFVSLCSPQRPNIGLMKDDEYRRRLTPPPKPHRWEKYRVAEFMLRMRNIHVTPTPARPQDCPRWMQVGFSLLKRIVELGYDPYSQSDGALEYLEVYPQAAYAVLLGQNPFLKHTLEGRIQRQLVLAECRINLPDPMKFFEEITRHRLLNGILPLELLYSPPELDALVAAYCAWLAKNQPAQVTLIGDKQEGQILLPGIDLKNRY